jgi:serine/threonine-protein kinase
MVWLDVDLGADVSLSVDRGPTVAISSNGDRLVYRSRDRLMIRRLDQPRGIELTGSEGGYAPFFSPDGQSVVFFAGGKLKKVSEGTAPITLCDAPGGVGGSWGEGGVIVAALNSNGGLSKIPSMGGTPATVSELDRAQGEFTHRWPEVLPGSKAVLFTTQVGLRPFRDASLEVISLNDHRRKTLVKGASFGHYLPVSGRSGYLMFIRQSNLYVASFDPDRLEILGTPWPLVEDVEYYGAAGWAQLSCSRSGTLVFGRGQGNSVAVEWIDSAGTTLRALPQPGQYTGPKLSPDGRMLAVVDLSNHDLWTYDFQRDLRMKLTNTSEDYRNPV